MRKKLLVGPSLALSIGLFGLGAAFPMSAIQDRKTVQSVSGGRKKAERRKKMTLTGTEQVKLASTNGREKKVYVRELKLKNGVALSKMDALIKDMIAARRV